MFYAICHPKIAAVKMAKTKAWECYLIVYINQNLIITPTQLKCEIWENFTFFIIIIQVTALQIWPTHKKQIIPKNNEITFSTFQDPQI